MRVANTLSTLAISIAALAVSAPAQAALTIDIQEVGPDVVATTSGTIDLAGLTYDSTIFLPFAGMTPAAGQFGSGDSGGVDLYTGATAVAFGTGGGQAAFPSSGFTLFLGGLGGPLGVQTGYVSGGAISSVATYAGHTFASLGVTPGTYEYTLPNDSIVFTIRSATAAVPEPATWATMLLGMFALGGVMRASRRRASLPA